MPLLSSLTSKLSISQDSEKTPFGKKFREKYYSFEKGVVPVNHGSYGSVPTPVLEAYHSHLMDDQSYPDRYIRFKSEKKLHLAIKQVSEIVDADPNCIAFVHNATTGVNTILRSYPFQKGDKILVQSTIYGACGNTVRFLQNRLGIEIVTVELNYPLEDDKVVSLFEEKFKESPVKLAIFDAVTSMPGVRLPFERIIDLCHKYNVLSLVDGAHSIGLVKYSLSDLKPDFYTSNLHKWYSCPRGCAFLYVDPKHHKVIHTLPVSHSYLDDSVELSEDKEKTRFTDRFIFTGSINFAPYDSIIDAKNFRETVCGGDDNIRKHNYELARAASALVLAKWGTSVIENETNTLMTAMFNVEIPIEQDLIEKMSDAEFMIQMREYIEFAMIDNYKTFIPSAIHNGKYYARFSCEVYNELDDYNYASEVFPKVLDQFLKSDLYKKLTAN